MPIATLSFATTLFLPDHDTTGERTLFMIQMDFATHAHEAGIARAVSSTAIGI
jgi:hypothetical protein